MKRTARSGVAIWAIAALVPVLASAHSFEPALLELREQAAGVFDLVWKTPRVWTDASQALSPQLPGVCRPLDRPQAEPIETVTFARVDCGPTRLGGQSLAVSGLANSPFHVIVRITWSDGTSVHGVLQSGAESFAVRASAGGQHGGGAGAGRVLASYLRLGGEHILLGFDHLLFVFGLLLLVNGARALVKTVTAFTLAHSVTLALSALQLVQLPAPPVEVLIAASIVLLARELVRDPAARPTLARRCPWLIAFVFGLLHGFGFAGALLELGLPPAHVPLALLAFNLGVEVGQLLFVAALLAVLPLLRRIPERAAWQRAPAYAIGAVAAALALERIARLWPPVM
ncbi:MAG: HupE/UreJ family protein [Deltaproteobacteria bacterium]|nr:HupE/UreJ family protein [Deltaproteobacteria bacterium]